MAAVLSSVRPSVSFRVGCKFSMSSFCCPDQPGGGLSWGFKHLGLLQVLCCRSTGSYGIDAGTWQFKIYINRKTGSRGVGEARRPTMNLDHDL